MGKRATQKANTVDAPEPVEWARTDMNCTECGKNFIAELDVAIDGDYVLECPYCGHEHCRQVKSGKVTDKRWDSRAQRQELPRPRTWRRDGMKTSAVGEFIRNAWLNRSDLQL